MIKLILPLYNLAWTLVLPFLQRSPRVRLGWRQRTLEDAPKGPYDIWFQAASGGESQLTNLLLAHLAKASTTPRLRVLATSGTKQGIDSLHKGQLALAAANNLEITVAYFPFDAPRTMTRAFALFAPKLAVIIETELWPGFLISAKAHNVPVLLVNGRMSEKSFRSYKHFRSFFKKYGPTKVLAIAKEDGERFACILGGEKERVELMHNLKFDRIEPSADFSTNTAIKNLLPDAVPFILLGSIRREEEAQILATIAQVLSQRPEIIIGLFPKHIERADQWLHLLQERGISAVKRSATTGQNNSGTVIVWDVFGELAGAYALATATFVGGSLVNLGGQNFLEPLVFGLKPIIGPYWKNFAWVGRDILSSGLVREVADETELQAALLSAIDNQDSRAEVINQARSYFAPKKGGTAQVCRQITEKLHPLNNE